MRRWRLSLRNVVKSYCGETWTTCADSPAFVYVWNFMRVKKALIGWWVYPNEILSTNSPATFKVIKPSANG